MAQIFKSYSIFFHVKEVWYICPKRLSELLKPLAAKYPFILFKHLEDIINFNK